MFTGNYDNREKEGQADGWGYYHLTTYNVIKWNLTAKWKFKINAKTYKISWSQWKWEKTVLVTVPRSSKDLANVGCLTLKHRQSTKDEALQKRRACLPRIKRDPQPLNAVAKMTLFTTVLWTANAELRMPHCFHTYCQKNPHTSKTTTWMHYLLNLRISSQVQS